MADSSETVAHTSNDVRSNAEQTGVPTSQPDATQTNHAEGSEQTGPNETDTHSKTDLTEDTNKKNDTTDPSNDTTSSSATTEVSKAQGQTLGGHQHNMTRRPSDLPISPQEIIARHNAASTQAGPLISQQSTVSEYSEITEQGNTDLHLACMVFDKVKVDKLIRVEGASVARTNRRERTCLHEMVATYLSLNLADQAASYKRMFDVMVILVQAGLDVNMGDLKWQTPLHYVVHHPNHPDVIRALTSCGVRVNAKDIQGHSSLHLAVTHGNISNVQALLEAGGDPNFPDNMGTSAMHIAAKGRHHTEVLRKLLLCGGLVDVQDGAKKTPLHVAAKAGRVESVRALLESRADITAKDNSHLTPLHLAAGSDMTGTICSVLIEWGHAHNPPINVNAIDAIYRETPLHRAVRMRMLKNIQVLVSGGAKVKFQDVSGDSALHKAARIYEIWAWKALMATGIEYSGLQNHMGLTAFQLAAKANNHIAMSMMRQHGLYDY